MFAAPNLVNLCTCAEYIYLPEESKEGLLAKKLVNMTYEEAAAVPIGGIFLINENYLSFPNRIIVSLVHTL